MMDSYHRIVYEDVSTLVQASLPWSKLRDQTILITGAAGYLASYLVYVLLCLNYRFGYNIKIVALVRNRERAAARFSDVLQRPELTLLVQDVCSPIVYQDHIDIIIHAASLANPKAWISDSIDTLYSNMKGTMTTLELADVHKSCRYLYFSSGAVLGDVLDKDLASEDDYRGLDCLQPRSCYGEGKRAGEALCAAYYRQKGLKTYIIRPFVTIGPGQPLSYGSPLTDFTINVLNGEHITLKSSGTAARSYTYITDMIKAAFTILFRGQPATAYNAGSDVDVLTIRQLAELFTQVFPEKKLVVRTLMDEQEYLQSAGQRFAPDVTRLRKLGWKPETPLDIAIYRKVMSHVDEFANRE